MPRENNFFELPLEAYHGKLPFPLVNIVQRLIDLKANIFENLFDNPNKTDNAIQLINELSKGAVVNWTKYSDVVALAYVFNNYLSNLFSYEPLIPIDCFTVISTMVAIDDLEKKINLCQSILSGLLAFKKARYTLIEYIFHFFKYIADNSSSNNMEARKISEIFTPIITVQGSSSDDNDDAAIKSIEFIIQNYEKIFNNSEKEIVDPKSYEMSNEEISSFRLPIIDFNLVSIAVNNCKYRKNHVIKFVPNAAISSSSRFKHPQRPPPPKPVTSTQLAVNMFDSTIERFKDDDNNKNFLMNVRHSVTQLNPMSADDTNKKNNKIRTQTAKPQPSPLSPVNQPPKTKPAPPISTSPPPAPATPANNSSARSSKTAIGNNPLRAQNEGANKNERPVSSIKDRAKFLNIPMGAPMTMQPPIRKSGASSQEDSSPAPSGMPIGAPRPKVTKDDDDTPVDVVVDPGKMIHRAPRRGGNRRPPKILSEA